MHAAIMQIELCRLLALLPHFPLAAQRRGDRACKSEMELRGKNPVVEAG